MSTTVITLGTGSPIPHPDRAGPATVVSSGDAHVLFDCGRGVVMRLAGAGLGPAQLSAVWLTHLHSDHICDLGDVITTRWITTFAPTPLDVVGPVGTAAHVSAVIASLGPDIGYRIAHHADLNDPPAVRIHEVGPGPVNAGVPPGWSITAAATDHRPVTPTLGFRVDTGSGVVAICGDTVPCDGLHDICADANTMVITAIRDDVIRSIGLPRLDDICGYHCSVDAAADTAAAAGVATLVITHHVPAPGPGDAEALTERIRTRFVGDVVIANDLDRIEI